METKPPSNWWGRNWKWLVPSGCLTAVAGMVGFIALIVTFLFGLIKASTPYKEALARAQADPVVISRLGTPISGGFVVSGSINRSGGSGEASLAIPLQGSRGSGTLYVEAHQSGGAWTYSLLTLQPDGAGGPISLLGPNL
jgi:hypothetical protein